MESKLPNLTVVAGTDALAQAAAQLVLAQVGPGDGRRAVCLTGGSTPEHLYRLLATQPYRGAIPWDRIHFFWGDDRFVPPEDKRSNCGIARRLLLDHVPLPPANIHPIPTDAPSVAEAARRYQTELQHFYGADRFDPGRPLFDVVLMGVGSDGHTASLFPGQAPIDEKERWVVGVPEAGLEPFVPRVTLTLPALASTRAMLFLVSGRGKRDILTRIMSGADLPAARAHSGGGIVWLVDRDAAPERRDVA
jgi:6-phosphogluconolactonase